MAKYRVLVADDSPQIRKLLCKIFADHDKLELCDQAVNGQDAVEKARANIRRNATSNGARANVNP